MGTNLDQSRDYLFDNYKALLIFLVVIAHFLDLCYRNTPFLYHLKWFIVSFHMPAFLFVSGYFSKRILPAGVLIQKLLIPYLVFECIYYAFYILVLGRETQLYLLYPKFSLWYILALLFFRFLWPYVIKIPLHMVALVVAGLLIGLSDMKSNFLSLPRIIVFFPFFLLGIHFKREYLTKYRTPLIRIGSALSIFLFLLYLILDPVHTQYSPKIFYGRYNYEYLNQSPIEGILVRLICYVLGFVLTILFALILSEKKCFVSYLGLRTLPIYLFHGLTYSYFKYNTKVLQGIDTTTETLLLILSCGFLVWVFSLLPFQQFTEKISTIPLPKMTKKPQGTP